ncbi:MAG: hypothetical protein KAI86_02975 [Desulfobacterales bacterium]|nr:hypothetical protein [Desulfobacterales bacterium]
MAARSAVSRGERVFRGVVLFCWVGTLAIGLFYAGLWIRDATFDFVYGDAARELIREMVKPEALKVDP